MFDLSKSLRTNKEPGETEVVLNQEDCTFEQLIKCSDLSNQYRSGNPKLLKFFSQKDNIKSIFAFLMKTNNRKDFETVSSLFKTSNMFLNRIFADSIEICDYILESINNDGNPCHQYAFGTFALFLSRSYGTWPKEVHEVLKYSNKAYKILIENIDKDSVYVFLDDLMYDTYPISEFIWHLFRALSGINEHPPHICYMAENIDVPNISDKKSHKLHAISIIEKFFKLELPMLEDFQEIVMNYICEQIISSNKYPEFFKIATAIGAHDRLEQIVLQKLQNLLQTTNVAQINEMSIVIAEWFSYLSICVEANKNNFITDELIIQLLANFLKENVLDLTLQKLVSLIDIFLTYRIEFSKKENNLGSLRSFVDQLKNILINSWNNFKDKNPTVVAFIMAFSTAIFRPFRMTFTDQFREELPYLSDLETWEKDSFILTY